MGFNGLGFDGFVGDYNSKDTLLTLSAIPFHLQPGLGIHIPI